MDWNLALGFALVIFIGSFSIVVFVAMAAAFSFWISDHVGTMVGGLILAAILIAPISIAVGIALA